MPTRKVLIDDVLTGLSSIVYSALLRLILARQRKWPNEGLNQPRVALFWLVALIGALLFLIGLGDTGLIDETPPSVCFFGPCDGCDV